MKRAIPLLLAALMIFALAGCGEKAAAELDAQALCDELIDAGVFSQKLDQLAESKAAVYYGLDAAKIAGAMMYHASGTCEEQAAVFTAVDEASAKEIAAELQEVLAGWIELDASYTPAEVAKLKSAVLRQSGVHVILVVAQDGGKAAELVGRHL